MTSTGITGPPAVRRPGLVLVYLFFGYGLLALGMGLVPALATAFWSAHDLSGSQIANVHNLKDLGLIGAMLVGPFILKRMGPSRSVLVAIGVGLSGCVVFVAAYGYAGVLAGAFLHGAAFSLGALVIVTLLFRLPERFRRIAALFATFGVASFVAPALVGALVRTPSGYAVVYLVFAVALGALLVAGLLLGRPEGAVAARADDGESRGQAWARIRGWLPLITVFATIMAAETIVVSWITSLAQYGYGVSLAAASALLATLWVVYTPVRALGDVLARKWSAPVVVLAGSLVAAVGTVLLCLGGMVLAYAGAVVFAIGIAPLIPVYQGWTLNRTPHRQHGSMNAALGVGSALVTTFMVWVTGLAIDLDIRLPFAISVALLLAVQAWAWRATRRAARRRSGDQVTGGLQRGSGDAEDTEDAPIERAA